MKKKLIYKSTTTERLFVAGDNTHLRELLHPINDEIDLPYSVAHAHIKVGESSLLHALSSSEVYYFLQGEGKIVIGKTEQSVQKGDLVVVPPSESQYVSNTGDNDLVFLCIVSPFWKKEEEIIF